MPAPYFLIMHLHFGLSRVLRALLKFIKIWYKRIVLLNHIYPGILVTKHLRRVQEKQHITSLEIGHLVVRSFDYIDKSRQQGEECQ